MTTAPEWMEEIDRRRADLLALRRDLHRHPELSFEERRTAEIIAERQHPFRWPVTCSPTSPRYAGSLPTSSTPPAK